MRSRILGVGVQFMLAQAAMAAAAEQYEQTRRQGFADQTTDAPLPEQPIENEEPEVKQHADVPDIRGNQTMIRKVFAAADAAGAASVDRQQAEFRDNIVNGSERRAAAQAKRMRKMAKRAAHASSERGV